MGTMYYPGKAVYCMKSLSSYISLALNLSAQIKILLGKKKDMFLLILVIIMMFSSCLGSEMNYESPISHRSYKHKRNMQRYCKFQCG